LIHTIRDLSGQYNSRFRYIIKEKILNAREGEKIQDWIDFADEAIEQGLRLRSAATVYFYVTLFG